MAPARRVRAGVIVVPVYNEARALPSFLGGLAAIDDRVLFVNDGSTDDSASMLAAWARGRSARIVSHDGNLGMSAALRTGFSVLAGDLATGAIGPEEIVVTLDADGQIDPRDVLRVAARLAESGADLVAAHRDFRTYPRYKRIGNALLTGSASLLAGFRYRDVECGLRAMRARILPSILGAFTGLRYSCATEIGVIVPRLGYRVLQDVPIEIRHYRLGAGPWDGVTNLLMGPVALVRALRARRRTAAA